MELVVEPTPVPLPDPAPVDEQDIEFDCTPEGLGQFATRIVEVQNNTTTEVERVAKRLKYTQHEVALLKSSIAEMMTEHQVTRDLVLELRGQFARGRKEKLLPTEQWDALEHEISTVKNKRKARQEAQH